ncbi:tetraacyldisaccharide 4'-kinase [Ponticoccus sp. SC2-23]|uniref:tetraacyldisaccharide 4'-kinase n=1 Tax=Alexandriicola marinus TaxID=2081710 RepID=UPI000FD7BE85|nr:tetraacyldisaccharide 4'-kinase [Alexandriicola marinus]MBM1221839.1 tetraacyldisaccharide 4'-kinase [Ponticoccus sp. SC6-9]MBM1226190.1 tetraacyldisaccharide 4'-kinase [Ponticoccus sp. SC6-15]MBM1230786.1 tetraacyldisaccharide 4'-kinase [Ponticoccus sp. SC6-38]MBM1235373.1 tetraacyldisaccharide 4'-kinase [Ponticoccus sp. SC6-45]MBM1239808.1 tetraacyldisaccharide 4'-kinase [Ponticoccus sp. SC6-49]MBM1243952.1 tetraacyldisaccharide 4'-kinase [Ponticoccus sp. SC2-64]MBM1248897.1 tetraacyldi
MRAPGYWFNPPERPGHLARSLAPLGWVYAQATARRVARAPAYQAGVPVICVGNINAGGTGKTPTTIAIVQRLQSRGLSPVVVTRGYGGSLRGPVRVNPESHDASQVGDEALLHAAFAPTIVADDRIGGCKLAEAGPCDVIILDDGHQDPAVRKSLSLVVVDAARGFGNGRVIPAGPLREPVGAGLARADAVVSIGPAPAQRRFAPSLGTFDLPLLMAELKPLAMGLPWTGRRVLAFAGIGHPEKFFAMLRADGAEVIRAEALSDHQPLTDALMTRLSLEARASVAQLVTTEKDFVRLPAGFRSQVLSVPVRLEFDDPSALDTLLDRLGLIAKP